MTKRTEKTGGRQGANTEATALARLLAPLVDGMTTTRHQLLTWVQSAGLVALDAEPGVREGAVGHLGRRGARRSVARSGGRSVRQNGHLIASGLMSSAQYGQGVRASPASGSSSSCPSRRLPSAKRNAKAIRGEVMRLTKNQPKLLRRSRSA